jgi:pyruvate formate lyase activating enzyme
MCHNADLVLRPRSLPPVAVSEVIDFLQQRAGKITGVVLTGGEPTLQPGLGSLLKAVRDLGYAVKLDTNGYQPEVLTELLDAGLLDYVAMDVKAPLPKYPLLAGLPDLKAERIERSVAELCRRRVPCELRTTVVPGLLEPDDIEAIARWIADREPQDKLSYVLQQFRSQGTLDSGLRDVSPYPSTTLHKMADLARRWVQPVAVRGV